MRLDEQTEQTLIIQFIKIQPRKKIIMGDCMSKIIPSTTTIQAHGKVSSVIQKPMLNQQFGAELPNLRQRKYWERKLVAVCGVGCDNISQAHFLQLFRYSEMKEESLRKLFQIFKINQKKISNQKFMDKLNLIGASSDEKLANYIYHIYFSKDLRYQPAVSLFEDQLKNFIKEKPDQFFNKSLRSSRDTSLGTSGKMKDLSGFLSQRQIIQESKNTEKWIRKNLDFYKFKLHIMDGDIKNDEKNAFKEYAFDFNTSQSKLGVILSNQNPNIIIISWKWCQKMLEYMQSKYQIDGAPKLRKRPTLDYQSVRFNSRRQSVNEICHLERNGSNARFSGSRVINKIQPLGMINMASVNVKQKIIAQHSSHLYNYPGEIQNHYLIGDFKQELRRNIRKNIEYTTIKQSTYNRLYLAFGGGPKIIRRIINGYIQLRPYFINTFYFNADQLTNLIFLEQRQSIPIPSNTLINQCLGNRFNEFVCYHKNIGGEWNRIPFINIDSKNTKVTDTFTQTSFLIYMQPQYENDFKKIYVQKVKSPSIGQIYSSRTYKIIDSVEERTLNTDEIEVCIVNDQQKAFIQFVVLNWSHNIQRKIPLHEFLKNFTLVRNQNKKMNNRRAGIANLGNTCYMNSSIQAILSTIKQQNLNKPKGQLGIQLLELAKKLQKGKTISPVDFKTAFDNCFDDFKGQDQHDAHQFCLRLFQQFQTDNKPLVQKLIDLKLNFVSKCNNCQNKIQRIVKDFVVSVPIKDFQQRQVKIDYIIDNTNIQTVEFTVKQDCTIEEWRKCFEQASGAQNYYLCCVEDCEVKRTYNREDQFQSNYFRDLNIQRHDLITAYETRSYQFNSNKVSKSVYKFATCKEPKGGLIVVRVLRESEESSNISLQNNLQRQTIKKCLINFYNSPTDIQTKTVYESQLLRFPEDYPTSQVFVKLINYDNTYGEKIGKPFIFKLCSKKSIQEIRLALQNCIGTKGYALRLSRFNQIEKCHVCRNNNCSSKICYQTKQELAPICWVQGKLEFVVGWTSAFEYNSVMKRLKWMGQTNMSQFDSFQQCLLKYQQKQQLQLAICESCKKKNVLASCRTLVHKWPDLLIIQLKRFTVKGIQIYKIHTKWKLQQILYINKIKYVLRAVICHVGQSADCGHYITVSNGLSYDDEVVSQKKYEDIPPEYIYMLFYHKEQ